MSSSSLHLPLFQVWGRAILLLSNVLNLSAVFFDMNGATIRGRSTGIVLLERLIPDGMTSTNLTNLAPYITGLLPCTVRNVQARIWNHSWIESSTILYIDAVLASDVQLVVESSSIPPGSKPSAEASTFCIADVVATLLLRFDALVDRVTPSTTHGNMPHPNSVIAEFLFDYYTLTKNMSLRLRNLVTGRGQISLFPLPLFSLAGYFQATTCSWFDVVFELTNVTSFAHGIVYAGSLTQVFNFTLVVRNTRILYPVQDPYPTNVSQNYIFFSSGLTQLMTFTFDEAHIVNRTLGILFSPPGSADPNTSLVPVNLWANQYSTITFRRSVIITETWSIALFTAVEAMSPTLLIENSVVHSLLQAVVFSYATVLLLRIEMRNVTFMSANSAPLYLRQLQLTPASFVDVFLEDVTVLANMTQTGIAVVFCEQLHGPEGSLLMFTAQSRLNLNPVTIWILEAENTKAAPEYYLFYVVSCDLNNSVMGQYTGLPEAQRPNASPWSLPGIRFQNPALSMLLLPTLSQIPDVLLWYVQGGRSPTAFFFTDSTFRSNEVGDDFNIWIEDVSSVTATYLFVTSNLRVLGANETAPAVLSVRFARLWNVSLNSAASYYANSKSGNASTRTSFHNSHLRTANFAEIIIALVRTVSPTCSSSSIAQCGEFIVQLVNTTVLAALPSVIKTGTFSVVIVQAAPLHRFRLEVNNSRIFGGTIARFHGGGNTFIKEVIVIVHASSFEAVPMFPVYDGLALPTPVAYAAVRNPHVLMSTIGISTELNPVASDGFTWCSSCHLVVVRAVSVQRVLLVVDSPELDVMSLAEQRNNRTIFWPTAVVAVAESNVTGSVDIYCRTRVLKNYSHVLAWHRSNVLPQEQTQEALTETQSPPVTLNITDTVVEGNLLDFWNGTLLADVQVTVRNVTSVRSSAAMERGSWVQLRSCSARGANVTVVVEGLRLDWAGGNLSTPAVPTWSGLCDSLVAVVDSQLHSIEQNVSGVRPFINGTAVAAAVVAAPLRFLSLHTAEVSCYVALSVTGVSSNETAQGARLLLPLDAALFLGPQTIIARGLDTCTDGTAAFPRPSVSLHVSHSDLLVVGSLLEMEGAQVSLPYLRDPNPADAVLVAQTVTNSQLQYLWGTALQRADLCKQPSPTLAPTVLRLRENCLAATAPRTTSEVKLFGRLRMNILHTSLSEVVFVTLSSSSSIGSASFVSSLQTLDSGSALLGSFVVVGFLETFTTSNSLPRNLSYLLPVLLLENSTIVSFDRGLGTHNAILVLNPYRLSPFLLGMFLLQCRNVTLWNTATSILLIFRVVFLDELYALVANVTFSALRRVDQPLVSLQFVDLYSQTFAVVITNAKYVGSSSVEITGMLHTALAMQYVTFVESNRPTNWSIAEEVVLWRLLLINEYLGDGCSAEISTMLMSTNLEEGNNNNSSTSSAGVAVNWSSAFDTSLLVVAVCVNDSSMYQDAVLATLILEQTPSLVSLDNVQWDYHRRGPSAHMFLLHGLAGVCSNRLWDFFEVSARNVTEVTFSLSNAALASAIELFYENVEQQYQGGGQLPRWVDASAHRHMRLARRVASASRARRTVPMDSSSKPTYRCDSLVGRHHSDIICHSGGVEHPSAAVGPSCRYPLGRRDVGSSFSSPRHERQSWARCSDGTQLHL
jgi:hypothetical protein